MITREYLKNRIREMNIGRDRLMAELNSITGAIEMCHQLLASLAAEAAAEADADAAQAETHEAAAQGESLKANGEASAS